VFENHEFALLHKGLKYTPNIPTRSKEIENLISDCEVALDTQDIGTKTIIGHNIPSLVNRHEKYQLTSLQTSNRSTLSVNA
jgi:hypothetical protein